MLKRLLTLNCAALCLLFCTLSLAENPAKPAIYTEEKPSIVLNPHESTFVIRLKSNPTTGYAWFLREYDASLVTPVKHVFEKPAAEKLMGAAGYEQWTFHVKSAAFTVPQQTTLRFNYTRPWETNDSGTQVMFRVSTVAATQ